LTRHTLYPSAEQVKTEIKSVISTFYSIIVGSGPMTMIFVYQIRSQFKL